MNPLSPGYLSGDALLALGFRALGENVQIASNCTVVDPANIAIGDNVRIDGYCSLIATGEGRIDIGCHVHIGGYCHLSGGNGIEISDFAGLSQGVKVYSRTDDYTGEYMTNPTVPAEYTGATGGVVSLGRHVIVGAGAVILPNVEIAEGSSVGALSLVTKSLHAWGIYAGTPARRLRARSKRLLELEAKFRGQA